MKTIQRLALGWSLWGICTLSLPAQNIAQQAYIKASNAGYGDGFGDVLAISGDTMVVGAPSEASAATGVNGDQNDDSASYSGAAYVFVRNGATWTQQAYLKASNTDANDRFGNAVAISGDVIVIGAPQEASSATGVNGAGSDNSAANSGAAYVFVRSGGTWTQQAYLKASNTEADDSFGWAVAVSGETVAVGAFTEKSNATGINGNQLDNTHTAAGAVYVFTRTGSTWTQEAYVKASNTGWHDEFGWSVALDGETMIVGARMEYSAATGVNGNQNDDTANQAGAAYVFVRNAGTWTQQAYLKAFNTTHYDWFGHAVALSGDTAIVTANHEQGSGTGVNPPDDDLTDGAGAAYIFVRNGATWTQQAYVKSPAVDTMDEFGLSASISGDVAVVGALLEDSDATGVNGDFTDNSLGQSGAAYVFLRTGDEWAQQAYLKASNADADDQFSSGVAVFGDTVAVGARYEDSLATGINGDQGNASAQVGAAYVFTGVGVPRITVEQPITEVTPQGKLIDFGRVGVKMEAPLDFVIRNVGTLPLTDIAVTITGPGAGSFSVTVEPDDAIAADDSTMFTLEAKPTSVGLKTAVVRIASNDPAIPSFVINVKATGFAVPLPAAVTLPATDVQFDPMGMGVNIAQAVLHGSVDANGYLREVFFDYGPSKSYGSTASAQPATASGSAPEAVGVSIGSLQPHTLYHFRVRAAADYGNANGADRTFLTPNHPPSASADGPYLVHKGGTLIIDAIDNDDDSDGDALTIISKTAVSPTSAGSVKIIDNALVFTASNTVSAASFDYTISDGFGQTSTATVSLTPGGTVGLVPADKTIPSAAASYTINVTADGAWTAAQYQNWTSVIPVSASGNAVMTITVAPNPSLSTRTGYVRVGGSTHTIYQSGVQAPSLDTTLLPGTLFNTIVGEDFSITLPTINPPVTYKVTGTIPPGLKVNHVTGRLEGIPTKAGHYPLTVNASNLAGKSPTALTFTVDVDALRSGNVGTFHGYILRSGSVYVGSVPGLGSRFEVTTSPDGSATGKITEGGVTRSFVSRLSSLFTAPETPVMNAKINGTNCTLSLTFTHSSNTCAGQLRLGALTATATGWRRVWTTAIPAQKASAFKGLHNFAIQNTTATGPGGYGYGTFSVNETTGNLTTTGRLADGSKLLSSTFVGPGGEVLLYNSLYGNRGSVLASFVVAPGSSRPASNTLNGSGTWMKPSPLPTSKDTIYRDGFADQTLNLFGGAYVAPSPGARVMAVDPVVSPNNNSRLDFALGGLETEGKEFRQLTRTYNPSLKGLTNSVFIAPYNASISPNPNPNKVAIIALSAANGQFSGSFTIPGATTALNRRAPFYGAIVYDGAITRGYGYFLLPKVPAGTQTVTTSPKLSGSVLFSKWTGGM